MTEAIRGSHRAAHKPEQTTTGTARTIGKKASAIGRGSALLVASSSLVVGSVMIPAASAQDLDTDVNSITAEADGNASISSVVVSNAVIWSDDATSLKVKRTPKPKVEQTTAAATTTTTTETSDETAPERSSNSSRSSERTSLSGGSNADTDKAESKSSKKSADDESKSTKSGDDDSKGKNAKDAIDSDDLETRGAAVIEVAKRYIGVPYRYGGSTPSGFDCSGFTSYVFAKFDINLPRTSGAQRYAGKVVSAKDAVPGDIVWSPGHVAIYIGNGKIIDAPRPGKSVMIRSMYQSNPVFIRVL